MGWSRKAGLAWVTHRRGLIRGGRHGQQLRDLVVDGTPPPGLVLLFVFPGQYGRYWTRRTWTYCHSWAVYLCCADIPLERATQGNPLPRFSGKEFRANAGDAGLIHGYRRSPDKGNSSPLQYFVWKIPWTEECGGLQFLGLQKELDRT